MSKILYTKTDEAPALATASFLPIVKAFTCTAHIDIVSQDISLAGRILAAFPEYLTETQRVPNALMVLGEMAKQPEANIIKLPNISASLPQLKEAIAELREKGLTVPPYPNVPKTDKEKDIRSRYDKIKGSAVNPVLREGNSDRRAPKAVKNYAKNNPHKMGPWRPDSKTHVATMSGGDFKANEKSITLDANTTVKVVLETPEGKQQVLKEHIDLLAGEIIDATVMEKKALVQFLEAQKQEAKEQNVLFSVHLKATMMKVSDPIIFGLVMETLLGTVLEKHSETLKGLGYSPKSGLEVLYNKLADLPREQRETIENDLREALEEGPDLAMVNSDEGITNLHVPSDIIIDASMPAMIRNSGQMWNAKGQPQDTKAVIPDSSYAGIYQATIDFCKQHGAFDPTTMGTVPNVGLMAQKAEEYGSHDKTFEMALEGRVKVIDMASGKTLLEHQVAKGDIWRMCQVKDAPIRNWVQLAVSRARATQVPAVFWLDQDRAHDAQLIAKVNHYLQEEDTNGLELYIMSPVAATKYTLQRIKDGQDTISVSGNVLRDYLTDLFPILEVGTSAKMLSIVPLMNGGGLFETGAGGSAPKHVQQFLSEGHLRWDSLGEFLALGVSLEFCGEKYGNRRAAVLGECLDRATETLLEQRKTPSRKVNELDTRGSHFYLALYWAQALAGQKTNVELSNHFTPVYHMLRDKEAKITEELLRAQGSPQNLGGYYLPNEDMVQRAMRPSDTFNDILDEIRCQVQM
ncbi:NADP-dependent isocitrate dehydrogenase [Maribacter sp. 2307ULW6-5]|uniref:NADP-dependent isocitrate dehydrogenase n=1 Tax=Maribacter sp. 2307ULW6-5 TaxID=3386275 RepID=UPI0039BC95E5